MKILVCVSKTPDTTAKVSFTPDNKAYNGAGVQFIMNPYDEWYALVRAIDLAKQAGGTCTIFSVGGADVDSIIRKGLAIGANDAVRVNAEPMSSMMVARQAATYAAANGYDLVFTGKETIDYHGSEVGAMIAEMLDWPFVSYGSELTWSGNTATISRDIEGGVEVVEVDAPFVVSASKGMAEQRIPNMMGIVGAKNKPLVVIDAIASEALTEVSSFTMPAEKTAVKMIAADNMDELVNLLHNEAKVI